MTFLKLPTKTIIAITIAIFILSSGLALPAMAQTSTAAPAKTPTNFHIIANPSSLTIKAGTKETVTITIASQTKFTGRVNLCAQTNRPRASTNLPSSIWFPKGATSVTTKLTITVGPKAVPGPGKVIVTAISGSLSHSITINLKIVNTP